MTQRAAYALPLTLTGLGLMLDVMPIFSFSLCRLHSSFAHIPLSFFFLYLIQSSTVDR